MNRIKVIVKPVGKIAHVEWVDNTLEAFQRIVGGYIETVTVCSDLLIVCNEEGRLLGLPYNCNAFGADFVGDIVFVGHTETDFADIPVELEQIKQVIKEV